AHGAPPRKAKAKPHPPASLGGTDTFAQASILTLYDPDRAQTALFRGEYRGWGGFLLRVKDAPGQHRVNQGAGLHFLTETITSPTVLEQISLIQKTYPQAKWHRWDAVSQANDAVYHFDKADVIVSLDADVFAGGPASIRYSRDF